MLTTQDIAKAANDERWLGFGYLGGRSTALTSTDPEAPAQPLVVEATDQRVIDFANEHGWTYEDQFAWCNSRPGRHFADAMFGSNERFDRRFERAVGWGLLVKVEAD